MAPIALTLAQTGGSDWFGALGSPVDLTFLLPVVPAVSALLLLLVGKRMRALSGFVGVLAAAFTAALAIAIFAFLMDRPEESRVFVQRLGTWVVAGPFQVDWAFLIDPLSAVMLLLVTVVGFLIHV